MSLNVVIPVFPGVTQLDFSGPAQLFAYVADASVYVVAASREPIATDSGFSVSAATTFADCPDADLLCVPGGPGVFAALAGSELLAFVKRQAATARYVSSVCTGMFVLGAIGLLKGRRVTSHWGYTQAIETCGGIFTPGRVVIDGSLITAGGVTAGIDYGLTVIAELFGEELAKSIQLRIEYDPCPPFASGHPSRASEQTLNTVKDFYRQAVARMQSSLSSSAAQSLSLQGVVNDQPSSKRNNRGF